MKKIHDYVVSSMTRKVHLEMKEICSLKSASLLISGNETIQNFSWAPSWEEFSQRVPTLLKLLQKILPRYSKMFLSCLIFLILKERCKQSLL